MEEDRLTGVRLADGDIVPCSAVAVATFMRARTGFLAGIGLTPVVHPAGIAEHLPTDGQGRTGAPGVWAAGNVTDPSAQVCVAGSGTGGGNTAGGGGGGSAAAACLVEGSPKAEASRTATLPRSPWTESAERIARRRALRFTLTV